MELKNKKLAETMQKAPRLVFLYLIACVRLVSAIANQTEFDIIKQTLYDCLGEQSRDVDIFLHYRGRIVIRQLADEEELDDGVFMKYNYLLFPKHRLRLETVAEGSCEMYELYSHDYDEIYSEEDPRHFERLGVDVEF